MLRPVQRCQPGLCGLQAPRSMRVHASPLGATRPACTVLLVCSFPLRPNTVTGAPLRSRCCLISLLSDVAVRGHRSDHRRGCVSFRGSSRWEDGASIGRSTGQQNIQTGTRLLWRTVGLICTVLRRERCVPPEKNAACRHNKRRLFVETYSSRGKKLVPI